MRKPQTIYLWTTLVWLTCVTAHLIDSVLSSLATPQVDEVYTQTLTFQAISFVLLNFPYWLLGLIALLVLEFAVVGRTIRRLGSKGSKFMATQTRIAHERTSWSSSNSP